MDRVGHQKMMTKAAGFDLELLALATKLLVVYSSVIYLMGLGEVINKP